MGISHNEPCRERREGGGSKRGQKKEGRRPKSNGERQSESDGDRLRARDKAPKEQLQELQRRCGPSPQAYSFKQHKALPDIYSQAHTHKRKNKNF